MIDRLPRVATVTALEPVEALVTAAETFRRHMETTPRVAVWVARRAGDDRPQVVDFVDTAVAAHATETGRPTLPSTGFAHHTG